MDPITHLPTELNHMILVRVHHSTLLGAETVCKAWQAFIHPFLRGLLLSHYYPTISPSEYPSLADRFISVLDENVVSRVNKFLVKLEKNQTALFSVVFPFNPSHIILIGIGKDIQEPLFQGRSINIHKAETLIFSKKIIIKEYEFDIPDCAHTIRNEWIGSYSNFSDRYYTVYRNIIYKIQNSEELRKFHEKIS